MATDGRTKRSQSICAPASASMEALAAPSETPAPRRRPAARSQSARITGARSVRQRRHQQPQLERETRTRYNSEPRLADAETPPQVRRQASARRRPPPSAASAPRRSNAFLDVPRAPEPEEPDEDSYRLRTFNTTNKGGQCPTPLPINLAKVGVVKYGRKLRPPRRRGCGGQRTEGAGGVIHET
ncbi:hypothetical protein EVAR_37400_1 [Eumeta japonica]|uniref:Uncharacterized protein n=1 Tax=Eumeta variegata TaxID=151549 RepID=A0A4C1WE19_EUMVA|nr:hypothetical protein EVAR_37400_1 [Eumeta japonica]